MYLQTQSDEHAIAHESMMQHHTNELQNTSPQDSSVIKNNNVATHTTE